ncbi:MAG: molybdate ABC transporter substrate-binding protein [Meiothermus sp.]|mgnify:FL=1
MKKLLFAAVALLGLAQAQQTEVRVAVAANLQPTFNDLIRLFSATNPEIKITPSFGSSGAFTQQIAQGAPFDIFMSADVSFPQELQKRELVEPGSLKIYAIGKLVLYVPNRVGLKPSGLSILSDSKIGRIIIANPETAPYGRAAVQAMTKTGIYDAVKGKIAQGQNISQAAQLTLASGDAGFIAYSAVFTPEFKAQGSYFIVPQRLYDRLEQAYVIVKGKARSEVRAFYDFLSSPQAQNVYRAWGYELPTG